MKKILFVLLFLIVSVQKIFSQTYVPMLNNSSWIVTPSNFGSHSNRAIEGGSDVVIGSYTYKKYTDKTMYSTDNYIREDVAAKKVYRYVNDADQLLFDFSLQVDDNIVLGDGRSYEVSSITNVNVNGGVRRMFHLVCYAGGTMVLTSETWIEGVGSAKHPLKPNYELYISDPALSLTCSFQNGVNIYNYGIANGQATSSDCSLSLDVEDASVLPQQINVSPNPFKTELCITTPLNFDKGTLLMFNSIGELVKQIDHVNGQKIIIERECLKSGLYFLQFMQNGKVFATNKVIVAD
ncbi:T9SS type A sorting domain-containing protein [Cytophaga aurantiaca]|uniref:T9SS type A sorting domain-containing protein n=1 Tax=Cytophaga aurantiaca TaxID=29530 RepID=UPI00037EC1A4|nr:T9SS type A sorting domain-containing protein [Cytophaga aurantiaca]